MTMDDAKAMVTISIHAPAKGATRQPRPLGKFKGISIHAPAKGATASGNGYYLFNRDFNPRSREGSDRRIPSVYYQPYISIHAPAKGATIDVDCVVCPHCDFNPRSREGSDVKRQPTKIRYTDFNPRSREGSDWNLRYDAV